VGAHNRRMKVFRSQTHSFWHDDIDNDQDREKLWRRVLRFLKLPSVETEEQRTYLFVRSIAGTDELELTETLYSLLKARFGKTGCKVVLLIILDDQGMAGPIMHKQHDGILFWTQLPFQGPMSLDGELPTPYEDAVSFAIANILGDPSGVHPGGNPNEGVYPSVNNSAEILEEGGPFREAGARHSKCGLHMGPYLVTTSNNQEKEVLISAFMGYDDVLANSDGSNHCKVVEQTDETGDINDTTNEIGTVQ